MPKKERKKERINAAKAYAEKNGKKIKRSAAALALAGLTTLSATTMSGCEDISNIFNSNTTSKPFDGYVDPYIEPTIKALEEIRENGITAEDVLAEFDKLAWDFNLRSYTWSIKDYDPDNWEEIVENSQTSAQFTKLTTDYRRRTDGFLPFYAICSEFDFTNKCYFLTEEEREVKLKDIYEATIFLDEVTYGESGTSHFPIGIHKSQFEPYANIVAPNKFKMSDYIEACENNDNCNFV